MFYVIFCGDKYPVLSVKPIIENNSRGVDVIVKTYFLIPAIPHEGIAHDTNFLWVDSEMCKYDTVNV